MVVSPSSLQTPLMVRTLRSGQAQEATPLWLMRQAGRYLPEYRAVRQQFPDFLTFCLTPDAATEVTLQPITRFDLDAAIIFADILTIPHALGHRVGFTAGHGPQVQKLTHPAQLEAMQARLPDLPQHLAPVGQTIRNTRTALAPHKAVIGFTGAPFTLACYLFDDKPSQGCPNLLKFQAEHPQTFTRLITVLTQAATAYLAMQVAAGADVVQVFDSWAGLCPPALLETAVLHPLQSLAQVSPGTPVILFPRGLAPQALQSLAQSLPPQTGLSLSTEVSLPWAVSQFPAGLTIQGNLDPHLLILPDPQPLANATQAALSAMFGHPHILNLGHGLTPETDITRVSQLVELVRTFAPTHT